MEFLPLIIPLFFALLFFGGEKLHDVLDRGAERRYLRKYPSWRYQFIYYPQGTDYYGNRTDRSRKVSWEWVVNRFRVMDKKLRYSIPKPPDFKKDFVILGNAIVELRPIVLVNDEQWEYYQRRTRGKWKPIKGIVALDAMGRSGADVYDGFERLREGEYVEAGRKEYLCLPIGTSLDSMDERFLDTVN